MRHSAVSGIAAASTPSAGGVRRWPAALVSLASLKLSATVLVLLAAAIVWSYASGTRAAWSLALPIALLAANLGAAIAVNPVFRRQVPLLVFHLALLALTLLVAAGQLTHLKGKVELSGGEAFAGTLHEEETGPFHWRQLGRVAFANEGFEIDYAPGLLRGETRNRVRYRDESGVERSALIGDRTPLVLHGYRFYTTPNKGFAPEVIWAPAHGGPAVRGTIHLPSFPAQLTRQELEWTPPGGSQALSTRLEIEERIVDLENPWMLRPPKDHALAIAAGGERVVLRPGESHRFPEGTLHYAGMRMWMGYSVFYDWTMPWLLAACALAAGALGWHYIVRFRREPWQGASAGVGA